VGGKFVTREEFFTVEEAFVIVTPLVVAQSFRQQTDEQTNSQTEKETENIIA